MAFLDQNPASAFRWRPGFGLLVGSFLNVVILRLPKRLEWQWQRDSREVLGEPETYDPPPPGHRDRALALPALQAPAGWYENIPVFSYLALRGRAATARRRSRRSTRWSNC